ncbi:MAG: hypothetical protein IT305_28850 [Chloroflexi bacterium]|nr:hypothetical protein [Chloroflexota bacterium]
MTGGQPVRGEPLQPSRAARTGWLDRVRAGRLARRVARGIARETPALLVDERPTVEAGAWAVTVTLPTWVDRATFAAAMTAECVPCLASAAPNVVLLPFDVGYSDEEQDHLVLAVAKVMHYLTRPADAAPAAG